MSASADQPDPADLVAAEVGAGEYTELPAALPPEAGATKTVNLGDTPPLPIPADTANPRLGPEVHRECFAFLPLIGVWRGTGLYGNEPGARDPQFGQQLTISHDGRAFLRYESISWKLTPDGPVPASRELGFWRPQPDGSVQLLVAHAEGRIEVFYGQQRSAASWALSTDGVWRSDGPPVVGATRLYGVTVDGRLAYVEERAHSDEPLAPYASAALDRIAG